jgi:glutaconate CoA-transferase subunit B
VDRLDFLTSPGHIDGQNTRGKLGLPGAGPELVITDRALFNFDNHSQEMTLFQIAPGESIESIQQEVGWPLLVSENLREMDLPTAEELALIREELDPQGMYR